MKTFKESPFKKLFDRDDIFNTEIFGEVRVSRFAHQRADKAYDCTRIDTKKGGYYFTVTIDDDFTVTDIVKKLDDLYVMRGKN